MYYYKNEKENLKKCITALKKDLFEIIVVDTGSNDGTQQMLEQMKNVQLEHFTWCNDFAAAKIMPSPKPPTIWLWS